MPAGCCGVPASVLRPGQAAALAHLGLDGAVASLTRPTGPPQLIGRPPHDDKGQALDPINVWGDDHCWWLDRMVRSNHQLIERMTLIWHSWFATSEETSNAQLMIRQNWMMRSHALGSFHRLLLDVTKDPAMLLWLNGSSNNKYDPNENYGREMLELFTLGADRGYNQDDVHQNARALTGWANKWSPEGGPTDFHFDPKLHDDGVKRIFGQRGRFTWVDSCRLAVHHLSPSVVLRREAVGLLRRRADSRPRRPRAGASLCRIGVRDPADRGGDPPASPVLRRGSAGHPAGRVLRRDAAREPADDRHHRLGPGSASRPARCCSSLRTSRAGTTPTGSTPPAGQDG